MPSATPVEPTAHPRSPAQIEAARRNGARSRGPVSPEGKARSSRNAVRHGLCSPAILAPGEDPEAFAALLADLQAEHAPRTASEALLVERLALTFWKLARCDRLQATLAAIEPHCPSGRLFPDPGLPRLLSRVPELNALLRHEAQLNRQLHQLLKALAGRGELEVPNEPEPCAPNLQNEPEPADRTSWSEPEPCAEVPPNEPEACAQDLRNEPEPCPSPSELRNEPEPARAGEAREPEPLAAAAPPGLLAQARTDPALARAILDQLLGNGDLRGYARAERALGVRGGGPAASEPAMG
jgi:hypothetical protein